MIRALAALAVAFWVVGCAAPRTESPGDPPVLETRDPEAFLRTNRLRPGVIETPSGLQYEIVRSGGGMKPKLGDVVHIIYSGRQLGSDEIIDKSKTSDTPDRVNFRNTIAGWQEALPLMPEGSTFTFYFPPSLAYGREGRGDVRPNTVLIYRIELEKVERSASER